MKGRSHRDVASDEAGTDEVSRLGAARCLVHSNAQRIAELGDWPHWIKVHATLCERIPGENLVAPGFDAGIACALELIPQDKQRLSATLHANYREESIEQVRREVGSMQECPDSETVWWLAACSVCLEEGVSERKFLNQIDDFKAFVKDAHLRSNAAWKEYLNMISSFSLEKGYPCGVSDGCIIGAYLDGHTFGVQYRTDTGQYLIGTYLPSLGLEEFDWAASPGNIQIAGSRQFASFASEDQFLAAISMVKAHLPFSKTQVPKT